MLVLLIFCSWAGVSTILKLLDTIREALDDLSADEWQQLLRGLQKTYWTPSPNRKFNAISNSLPMKLSDRVIVTLGHALGFDLIDNLYLRYLSNYGGNDVAVLSFCADAALRQAQRDPAVWPHALDVIKKLYDRGAVADLHTVTDSPFVFRSDLSERLPSDVAKEIAGTPDKYPRSLVFVAAEKCQAQAEEMLLAVKDIADQEGWFQRE
jgi:hypothetical protein